MAQLTKDLYQPWLDVARGLLPVPVWRRIDKSTQLELGWNPNTDDKDYIDQKSASTVLTGYQPELPEEIILDNANPMYAFLDRFCEEMPIGTDCVVPLLLVKPDLATGQPTRALLWDRNEVHADTLNTVDGLLSVTLALNGDMRVGSVEVVNGELRYTESGAATGVTVPEQAVSVAVGATAPSGAEPTGGDGYLVYAVEDPAIATVAADGAVTGVKAGTTRVHVLCTTGSGRFTGSFGVTVGAAASGE